MPHRAFVMVLVCACTILTCADAGAIPVFARKYNMPCTACHTGDFKLNAFGGTIDVNGFQLPGTIDRTPVWNSSVIPFSLMMQSRASHTSISSSRLDYPDTTINAFNNLSAILVSGGTLAPHVSYMVEYDVEAVASELRMGLEYAFVNFNNLLGTDRGELNVRVGKMRLETLIEQIPEFYYSQYLVYNHKVLVSDLDKSFYLSTPQYAIMSNMSLPFIPWGPQLTLAVSTGNIGGVDFDAAHYFYARLANDFDAGPVPVTLGLSAISGKQTRNPASLTALNNSAMDFGVDWLIQQPYGGPISLYGQIMKFHSTDVQPAAGLQEENSFGGYIELNDVLIPEKVTLLARYDFMHTEISNAPDPTINETQMVFIGKYHFQPNVHVYLETSFRSTDQIFASRTDKRTALHISGGFFFGI